MKIKLTFLSAVIGLVAVFQANAATVNQTLYINRGVFTTVNNTTFPYMAFNSTPNYSSLNTVINVTTNDVLVLKVINNDSITHGFDVKDYAGAAASINPGDSIIDTLTFSAERLYIY
jgi:phage tail sheath protein FI